MKQVWSMKMHILHISKLSNRDRNVSAMTHFKTLGYMRFDLVTYLWKPGNDFIKYNALKCTLKHFSATKIDF